MSELAKAMIKAVFLIELIVYVGKPNAGQEEKHDVFRFFLNLH
jgi:hypothetical protein